MSYRKPSIYHNAMKLIDTIYNFQTNRFPKHSVGIVQELYLTTSKFAIKSIEIRNVKSYELALEKMPELELLLSSINTYLDTLQRIHGISIKQLSILSEIIYDINDNIKKWTHHLIDNVNKQKI